MRRTALLVTLVSVVGACGGDDPPPVTSDQPPDTVGAPTTSSTTTTTIAAPPAVPALDEVAVRLTPVAELDAPLALAVRAGHEGVLYVAERGGRVRVLRDGELDPRPLVDISGGTTTDGERGLLGLAFSPDGAFLYLSYTNEAGDSRIDEYAMGAGDADVDLGSRREVLAVDQPFANHNGGHITFGPDGLFYFGLGDGGGSGDPEGNGQNPDALLGKILRIDPRPSGGSPYGVPGDNPFAGGGGRSEIWVTGVRNPWRFSFDRQTGDLWVADVGEVSREEVTRLVAGQQAGANLGWNLFEGSERFRAGGPTVEAVMPTHEYGRDEGTTITGGFVYRGSRIAGLGGAYVFGDYATSMVWALDGDGRRQDLVPLEDGQLVSFGEDAGGELYVLSLAGPVYRLDPA